MRQKIGRVCMLLGALLILAAAALLAYNKWDASVQTRPRRRCWASWSRP